MKTDRDRVSGTTSDRADRADFDRQMRVSTFFFRLTILGLILMAVILLLAALDVALDSGVVPNAVAEILCGLTVVAMFCHLLTDPRRSNSISRCHSDRSARNRTTHTTVITEPTSHDNHQENR